MLLNDLKLYGMSLEEAKKIAKKLSKNSDLSNKTSNWKSS